MIQMRHAGVYVRDLLRMQTFYREVFHMHVICDREELKNELRGALTGTPDARILMTKLITPQGKVSGYGDMVELLEVRSPAGHKSSGDAGERIPPAASITAPGTMHLCFAVDDLAATMSALERRGGRILIPATALNNGRTCAFAADPEGNILEVIA